MNQRTSSLAGVATVLVFAALSVGSSKPKGDSAQKPSTTTTTSAATGGDPSKTAKLIGSCDRSSTFHLDCSESFEPSIGNKTVADEKRSCDSLGGKFREAAPCPRMKAVTQCFEGYAPYLAGSYEYEGSTDTHGADACPRGFRDFRKDPELKSKTTAASCNAIATSGTCTQYSGLDADMEKSCLDSGGRLKQPAEPCPTTDVIATLKITHDGAPTEIENFYGAPYKGAGGTTSSWKKNEVAALCSLSSRCELLPPGGGVTAVPAVAAVAAATDKSQAKAKGGSSASSSSKAKTAPKKKK
jgi:hypothetical protein